MNKVRKLYTSISLVLGFFFLFQVFTSTSSNYLYYDNTIKKGDSYNLLSTDTTTDKNVYICKGPGSIRYHYIKSCRGLKSCSTNIFKVSISEAKKLKRTLCGWED